jgi:putative selenate reductase
MSDKFYQISIEKLFSWILKEEAQGKIFGMYTQNLYTPKANDPFRMHRYGRLLETPLGVAAGPQTQLAQNIIGAWLCGARYIELKTVQTLDEIHVSKPCIEVEDEGYNCEWSQELTLKGSFEEYLNAWIVMHVLKHKFGWEGDEQGFIFNMSVGYDYAGILKPNVQWFLEKMENCEAELAAKIEAIAPMYPAIRDIKIPSRMTDNITLSTMHGCPPNEIHKIGKYLIEERKLHTTIKLNPTLLGPERLREILNAVSGFTVNVPDIAFEHDLKYPDALELIKSLQQSAEKSGVTFNLKLTNTLESLNLTRQLPENEKMVYASGRALHPISINLAAKLQNDFDGKLDISFCAGVDAFNVADTLACGLKPITVCSDLLKPGGYMRMTQYVESLEKAFVGVGAKSIDEFIVKTNGKTSDAGAAALGNLNAYAETVLENKAYHKSSFPYKNIKTKRTLTEYDCVHAPCIEACAVDQNVPNYMYYTGIGDFENAYKIITTDNPIPNITGNVCDHLCQTKCTRMNYDNSLQIRAIKRFNAEEFNKNKHESSAKKNGIKVGIIGAGPAGLSCAYFLALEGFTVDVYESKPFAGGMPSDSIPEFRLSADRIDADIELVKSVGVNLHFNHKVDTAFFDQLRKDCAYIFIGIGAQKSKKLEIPGEDAAEVYDQLQFLSIIRRGGKIELGKKVAVIGGGNSAIDTARTANRIIGAGKVQVLYRRTINEMPADKEEVDALIKEGIEIIELTAPLSIEKKNGKLHLTNIGMELSEKDASGRRRPVPVKDSEFVLEFDNILTAIGQDIDLDFISPKEFSVNKATLTTNISNVFMGGDAVRGADSLINAVGDGKKAALKIAKLAFDNFAFAGTLKDKRIDLAGLQKKVAHREPGLEIHESPKSTGKNFELVHATITKEEAVKEAQRCLLCDDVCNICTTVCPNFANVAYDVVPMNIPTYKVVMNMGKAEIVDSSVIKISQKPQIINIRDFCNECGNCDSFCPTAGAPYKTKPKFHLTKESFDAEPTGFRFEDGKLFCKKSGFVSSLAFKNDSVVYESPQVSASFGKDDFELDEYSIKNGVSDAINLEHISEMFLLLKNLKDFPLFQ